LELSLCSGTQPYYYVEGEELGRRWGKGARVSKEDFTTSPKIGDRRVLQRYTARLSATAPVLPRLQPPFYLAPSGAEYRILGPATATNRKSKGGRHRRPDTNLEKRKNDRSFNDGVNGLESLLRKGDSIGTIL